MPSDVTRWSCASMRNRLPLATPAVCLGLLLLCCSAGAAPASNQSASLRLVEHATTQPRSGLGTDNAEGRIAPGFAGAEKLLVSSPGNAHQLLCQLLCQLMMPPRIAVDSLTSAELPPLRFTSLTAAHLFTLAFFPSPHQLLL